MHPERLLAFITAQLSGLFQSGWTFLVALLIALIYVSFARGFRRTRLKSLIRAMFAKKIWLSESAFLDFKYVLMGAFIFPPVLGIFFLSYKELGDYLHSTLQRIFGTIQPTSLSDFQCRLLMTVVLFLAYECAYYLDHYLKHRVKLLWEFHKTHHSATVLTPFTNARMHPVDSIIFGNIVSMTLVATRQLVIYLLGKDVPIAGENIILIAYICLYGHLQHSHVWMPFTGWLGKIFLSPAHHQIHHSTREEHYDKNFGASLAVLDWMFGTLYMPSKENQLLKFGVHETINPHYLPSSLTEPFIGGWRHIRDARASIRLAAQVK